MNDLSDAINNFSEEFWNLFVHYIKRYVKLITLYVNNMHNNPKSHAKTQPGVSLQGKGGKVPI